MTARHQVVADDLRRLITAGTYAVGERLPPETQLATRYQVSTPTLRDALGLLQAEGLVEKFQGRGNFVRKPPPRLEYPGADGSGGLHVIVSSADVTATGELAARLHTSPDAPLTEYVYLARRDDSPQSLAHVYLPHAVARIRAPTTSNSPWGDDIFDQLPASRARVPVATRTDQVTARFPTAAEAQSLRIAARTPVLAVDRTLLADDGRVVAYALLVLPGDRAQVAFTTPIHGKQALPEPTGKKRQDD